MPPKQGPCSHCGATSTPLWRKGPPDRPVLCNACGTRWKVKGTLEGYVPGQPVQRGGKPAVKPKTGPRYVKYVLVEDYVPPEERQEEITGRRERKKPRWMREMEDDKGLQTAILEESKRKAGSRKHGDDGTATSSGGGYSGRPSVRGQETSGDYDSVPARFPPPAYANQLGQSHAGMAGGPMYRVPEQRLGYAQEAAHHAGLYEGGYDQAYVDSVAMGSMPYATMTEHQRHLEMLQRMENARYMAEEARMIEMARQAQAERAAAETARANLGRTSARESLKRKMGASPSYQDLLKSFAPEDLDMLKEMMQSADGQGDIAQLREGMRVESQGDLRGDMLGRLGSHPSLTHLFSSPNLAGSAPPGQREAWGSAHASPVLPADDQYQPAFGGAYGPAAIPSSGPGTSMAAPFGSSIPWTGSRDPLPRVPSHHFLGMARMGSTTSLLGALQADVTSPPTWSQNGRHSPSLLRNVSYDMLPSAMGRSSRGVGDGTASGRLSGQRDDLRSELRDDEDDDGVGDPDDLEESGVDALRALKASNPDLMGLAAKMAKKNSVTNLAQLDSGAPDSEA